MFTYNAKTIDVYEEKPRNAHNKRQIPRKA